MTQASKQQARLRTNNGLRAALGGFAMLALSAVFNQAALADEGPLPAPAPQTAPQTVPQTAPQIIPPAQVMTAQQIKDQVMVDRLVAVGAHIEAQHERDPLYDAQQDASLTPLIDAVIEALEDGANGDLFPGTDGLNFLGGGGMTAFAAAIAVTIETGRMDLIEAFIDAGADVKQVAPDKWTPMDYAISSFLQGQARSRDVTRNAFAVLRRLEAGGALMSDAREIARLYTPRQAPAPIVFDEYAKLANSLMAVSVMEEAGVTVSVNVRGQTVTLQAERSLHGTPETAEDLSDETRLRRGFIEQNGGRLIHEAYSDAVPGGALFRVRQGDTLANIASRFYEAMGERTPLHAMGALMRANDMPAHTTLRPGQTLRLPVPPTMSIGWIQFREDMSMGEIADIMIEGEVFHNPAADRDTVIRELARVNGVSEADAFSDNYKYPTGRPFAMLFGNDTYRHMSPLTPPTDIDPVRRVDLVVIEEQGGEDEHRRQTYRSALGSNYAINRGVDVLRFFAWREHFMSYPPGLGELVRGQGNSSALLNLLTNPHNPLRDNLVFSQSMEISVGDPRSGSNTPKPVIMEQVWQGRPAASPELEDMREALRILERAAPIFFTAAGNQYANGEGPFKQSYAVVHSPRTYVIGAAGQYPVFVNGQVAPGYVMSAYSTAGADICAPLPYAQFRQMEGTSFSTPLMAGVFRQMNEWYGHRLTTEEIMAAALMSADRNVLDYDDPLAASSPRLPTQMRAHMAVFATNGAGLPFHHRCGAGVMNVERWQAMLDRMVELKRAPGLEGQHHSTTMRLGAPVVQPDESGNGSFVYQVRVPRAMTAGKFSFVIPQGQGEHGEVSVRMPSGFTTQLHRTLSDVVSSHAFAYEDLQEGAIIEIVSEKELGPSAEMTLRGFEGNNVVAQLRDELRASGVMPAPLSRLGGEEAQFPLPAAPAGMEQPIVPVIDEENDTRQPRSMSVDPLAPQEEGAPQDGTPDQQVPPAPPAGQGPARFVRPPAP